MDPVAELRAFGRYGLLYGGATAAVVAVVWRSGRAAAAVFVPGLAVTLVGGGQGKRRTGTGGDDPRNGAIVDTHVDVRTHTPTGRKARFHGVGHAVTGFAAMVVLGSVVRTAGPQRSAPTASVTESNPSRSSRSSSPSLIRRASDGPS